MLAQKEYKRRHDNIARLVHWKLCCKYDMSRGEKWYEHQREGVVENEKCKILWNITIQCDHVIEARRPDIVVEKENNKAIIVDIASPWDHRVYEKEGEKIEKYQELEREIGRLWAISSSSRWRTWSSKQQVGCMALEARCYDQNGTVAKNSLVRDS